MKTPTNIRQGLVLLKETSEGRQFKTIGTTEITNPKTYFEPIDIYSVLDVTLVINRNRSLSNAYFGH